MSDSASHPTTEQGLEDEPEFQNLSKITIAIFGLGLMGGSLALALKGRVQMLLAVDPDPDTRALAQRQKVVDHISSHPTSILDRADLIVLAAPVGAILQLIDDLPSWMSEPAVVLDLGSTKAHICKAYEALPPRFDPIGGHPMAGKETSGLAHASADLYRHAPFALTPLERTSPRARALSEALVRALDANPLWLDASTHDRWVAATSHMPYVLSSALALATPQEAAGLVGPGFRSTTRLAESSPSMMSDILTTNRGAILQALARLRTQLDRLEDVIQTGDQASILSLLEDAASYHNTLTRDRI
jgi:prephenate dehydrogenase